MHGVQSPHSIFLWASPNVQVLLSNIYDLTIQIACLADTCACNIHFIVHTCILLYKLSILLFIHSNRSSLALSLAKYNVARHYASIGTIEDLERFVIVLEYILPTFLKGFYKVYDEHGK